MIRCETRNYKPRFKKRYNIYFLRKGVTFCMIWNYCLFFLRSTVVFAINRKGTKEALRSQSLIIIDLTCF
jgi:hypothetical protein